MSTFGVDEAHSGRYQSALDQCRKRNARRFARRHEWGERRLGERGDRGDPRPCGLRIISIALDADKTPAEPPGFGGDPTIGGVIAAG